MEIKIWGSRGGMPVASQDVVQFGGNTTCLEVSLSDGGILIIDAGTGIQDLGRSLGHRDIKRCSVLFTHYHWDHIQGLPYFSPIYQKEWNVSVYGCAEGGESGVKKALSGLFHPGHFPLTLDHFDNSVTYSSIVPGDKFRIGSAVVECAAVNHPGGGLAYKITDGGWSFVFTGDHDHNRADAPDIFDALEKFIEGADMLIADGQYSREEYENHRGWGHSYMEVWPETALKLGVKHLVLTHHDLEHTDDDLDYYSGYVKDKFADLPIEITFARDGITFPNPRIVEYDNSRILSNWLSDLSLELSGYNDVHTILDRILFEARAISGADAGTVYLAEGNDLIFSYAHNDTLFPGSQNNRMVYTSAKIPVDETSIAGYAATRGKSLNIPDVYNMPDDVPYSFNDAFDRAAGYKTVSVLAVPFMGYGGKLLGVVQLINSMDGDKIVPFTKRIQSRLQLLSIVVANAVEKGMLADELILRMLKMSSLRDPSETAGHVRRVGAVAAELYQKWALKRSVPFDDMRFIKDKIRVAAMLHDVGKVGIPDNILKKNGPLLPEERAVIEKHCVMGATLFVNTEWGVDIMAKDITQHHHQKWNGSGYTGSPDIPVLSGEAIPLAARITAVADVFDALVSARSYKLSMSVEESLEILKKNSGSHFDPELIECFEDIIETVEAIYLKYAPA